MAPATAGTRTVVAPWRDWREWLAKIIGGWRGSLRVRTLVATLGLTALTILIALVWMALAIQNDLYESRVEQVESLAFRATQTAQTTLDAAEVEGDAIAVQNLMETVRGTITRQAATDMIAAFRVSAAPSVTAPQDFEQGGLVEEMVSAGLRERVRSTSDQQWWQSIAVNTEDGSVPGVLIGQQIVIPEAGAYELYFAYDLQAEAQTLQFVQVTLWGVGITLIVLIAAILWFVLRSVTVPIAQAADTSAKLAAGDLAVRLPVEGEDEFATLSRSFNAMADSIEAQIKELADLSLVQQRFVSDVSHELRTPLTTIRLATDMLNDQRETFAPAAARAAELLHAQVERFEVLLTDLLEISRYDAGSVELEMEPTSLAALAEDVIASMHHLAVQHGTQVRLVAPGGYSPVEMDPRRVRRILRNLLGNAIEHGEGLPIVVSVDSNQYAVALGVRDYGLGMREEDTERVFDRFWRADPSRKRTIGGTGLGLSIALGDARLHRGTLEVWSQPGRGTNFVLTLPRAEGPLRGPSPLPIEPADDGDALDNLGLTQPIDIVDLGDAEEPGGPADTATKEQP